MRRKSNILGMGLLFDYVYHVAIIYFVAKMNDLVHPETGVNLHSHNFRAPITTSSNEVSGYGNSTSGDKNDMWKIEIVDVCF